MSTSMIAKILSKVALDENSSVTYDEVAMARKELTALEGDVVARIVEAIERIPRDLPLPWRPIEELERTAREGEHPPKYGDEAGFLLLAPELVDEDCNMHGVGMGYWQDDGLLWNMSQEECDNRDPNRNYSCWLACKWDMHNDEWRHVACTPTHYLRLTGIRERSKYAS